VYPCHWTLDYNLLQESARIFLGTHNFLSFAASDPDQASRSMEAEAAPGGSAVGSISPALPSPVRTIYGSEWEQPQTEAGELLVYRVRGNGFLHHMVRNLVGTFVLVGKTTLKPENINEILQARNRAAAGATAPASGLYLVNVDY
jgi:tRNA pseudouridine38-40 synthase